MWVGWFRGLCSPILRTCLFQNDPSLPKSPKYLVSRCLDPLKALVFGRLVLDKNYSWKMNYNAVVHVWMVLNTFEQHFFSLASLHETQHWTSLFLKETSAMSFSFSVHVFSCLFGQVYPRSKVPRYHSMTFYSTKKWMEKSQIWHNGRIINPFLYRKTNVKKTTCFWQP